MQFKARLHIYKGKGGGTQTPYTIYKSISMSLEDCRGTKVRRTQISHVQEPALPSHGTVPGKFQPHGPSGPHEPGEGAFTEYEMAGKSI